MRGIAFLLAVAALVGACTSKPVPDDYHGPLAHISDSARSRSGTSADFFYLDKIDGRKIPQSLSATAGANYGKGFVMTPVLIGRDVPAQPSTYTIVARTHYAAPILEMVNPVYEASGDIKFAPQPSQIYYVRGELSENYSAVWIEDASGAPVAPKIEIRGSAALNLLQK